MRKITRESVSAFEAGRTFSKGNMTVNERIGGMELLLHDNIIAKSSPEGVFISNAGWATNTTKERLNGITGVNIHQSNFVWYLNGEEMPHDEFVKIS